MQKLLAAAGFGSRREIETWIAAGRVSVRGQTAKLGDRASPGDLILLDGKEIKISANKTGPRVIVYHKPIGELVTRKDPEGRATVFDRLPKLSPGRWVAVGRLDLNSSGLLLFTDSGELANELMHPRQEIEREYEVRVQGGLGAEAMRRLLAEAVGSRVSRLMRVRFGPAKLPLDLPPGRSLELPSAAVAEIVRTAKSC